MRIRTKERNQMSSFPCTTPAPTEDVMALDNGSDPSLAADRKLSARARSAALLTA
jgi:hypothetical protein